MPRTVERGELPPSGQLPPGLQFECPHCKSKLETSDDDACAPSYYKKKQDEGQGRPVEFKGFVVNCPECGTELVVRVPPSGIHTSADCKGYLDNG